MAELMKIVRNCYFEGCNKDTELSFHPSCIRISSYCNKCGTPLDVRIIDYRKEIKISCPRCLKLNNHKILGKTTKHILKCKTCGLVYRFKETYN